MVKKGDTLGAIARRYRVTTTQIMRWNSLKSAHKLASDSGSASKADNGMIPDHDTIVAPATAAGGAIAVVRVSGREAFALCDRMFRGRKPLAEADGYTVHYGEIMDGDRIVDDVLAAVFRAPHSYTGEDSVEISCHGSSYIVSEILRLLTAAGGRMAQPGEFTIRAYLAGKLDLSQAEAVADTIAASSRAAHALASTQMRGGYSDELERLRDKLLNLSLIHISEPTRP